MPNHFTTDTLTNAVRLNFLWFSGIRSQAPHDKSRTFAAGWRLGCHGLSGPSRTRGRCKTLPSRGAMHGVR